MTTIIVTFAEHANLLSTKNIPVLSDYQKWDLVSIMAYMSITLLFF